MAVVMALAGSLKVKGGVVPRTKEAPVLSVTMSIVIKVEITKTRKYLKIIKKYLINLINKINLYFIII